MMPYGPMASRQFLKTSPHQEWAFVALADSKGGTLVGAGGVTLNDKDPRERMPYETLMETKANLNDRLHERGIEKLLDEEAIGARLLTGPMIRKYNLALYNESGKLEGEFARSNKGNKYPTTIQVINSAVCKCSRLTQTQVVYRTLTVTKLPDSFFSSNVAGVMGGFEVGFTWATLSEPHGEASEEKDESQVSAEQCSLRQLDVDQLMMLRSAEELMQKSELPWLMQKSELPCRLELQMTQDERGADLNAFSQFPEAGCVFFAPLVAMEVQRSHVRENERWAAGAEVVVRASLSSARTVDNIMEVVKRRQNNVLELCHSFAQTLEPSHMSVQDADKWAWLDQQLRAAEGLKQKDDGEKDDDDEWVSAKDAALSVVKTFHRWLAAKEPIEFNNDQAIGNFIQEGAQLIAILKRWPELMIQLADLYIFMSDEHPIGMRGGEEAEAIQPAGSDVALTVDAAAPCTLEPKASVRGASASPAGPCEPPLSSRSRSSGSLEGSSTFWSPDRRTSSTSDLGQLQKRRSVSFLSKPKVNLLNLGAAASYILRLQRLGRLAKRRVAERLLHPTQTSVLQKSRGVRLQKLLQAESLDLCELRADTGDSFDSATNPLSFSRDDQRAVQQHLVESAAALLCLSDRLHTLHLQGIEIDGERSHALRSSLQERKGTRLHIGYNSMEAADAMELALALCTMHIKHELQVFDAFDKDCFGGLNPQTPGYPQIREAITRFETRKQTLEKIQRILDEGRWEWQEARSQLTKEAFDGLVRSGILPADYSSASLRGSVGFQSAQSPPATALAQPDGEKMTAGSPAVATSSANTLNHQSSVSLISKWRRALSKLVAVAKLRAMSEMTVKERIIDVLLVQREEAILMSLFPDAKAKQILDGLQKKGQSTESIVMEYGNSSSGTAPEKFALPLSEWTKRAGGRLRLTGPFAEVQDAFNHAERLVKSLSDKLVEQKMAFLDEKLFYRLLLSARQTAQLPDQDTKFREEMIFDPRNSYVHGLNGRLRKLLGLEKHEEVEYTRSIREEFEQNDGGKWLEHLEYVLNHEAIEDYPSTKGRAPDDSAATRRMYTRELGHALFKHGDVVRIFSNAAGPWIEHMMTGRIVRNDLKEPAVVCQAYELTLNLQPWEEHAGQKIEVSIEDGSGAEPLTIARFDNVGMRLKDFWHRQPARQRLEGEDEDVDEQHELTVAEVATIRLYTGPAYVPLNRWLRGTGDERRSASGLKWIRVAEDSCTGVLLPNMALSEALAAKSATTEVGTFVFFTEREWGAFKVQYLRMDHFVQVGGKPAFRPVDPAPLAASGLTWNVLDAAPPVGVELDLKNNTLAKQLSDKRSFTPLEWSLFNVKDLHTSHYVRSLSGEKCFQPAEREKPAEWTTTISVLYQALVKLSVFTNPATVFRGVKTDELSMPEWGTAPISREPSAGAASSASDSSPLSSPTAPPHATFRKSKNMSKLRLSHDQPNSPTSSSGDAVVQATMRLNPRKHCEPLDDYLLSEAADGGHSDTEFPGCALLARCPAHTLLASLLTFCSRARLCVSQGY